MNWFESYGITKPYYSDDAVCIIHADCRLILPLIPDKFIDLVLTDPPYGINYKGGQGGNLIHSKGLRKSERVVGDEAEFDIQPLLKFQRLALFGGHRYYHLLPSGGSFHVWDKRGDYKPVHTADFDTIWVNWHMVGRKVRSVWRGLCRETEATQPILHPTQKPIAVVEWLIHLLDEPQIIIDPFLGSGTTAYCAKKLGRKCIGVEIEEKYCEIAAKRCSQTTLDIEGAIKSKVAINEKQSSMLVENKQEV